MSRYGNIYSYSSHTISDTSEASGPTTFLLNKPTDSLLHFYDNCFRLTLRTLGNGLNRTMQPFWTRGGTFSHEAFISSAPRGKQFYIVMYPANILVFACLYTTCVVLYVLEYCCVGEERYIRFTSFWKILNLETSSSPEFQAVRLFGQLIQQI